MQVAVWAPAWIPYPWFPSGTSALGSPIPAKFQSDPLHAYFFNFIFSEVKLVNFSKFSKRVYEGSDWFVRTFLHGLLYANAKFSDKDLPS